MTALLFLDIARLKLKLWRIRAMLATTRLARRALHWLAPPA